MQFDGKVTLLSADKDLRQCLSDKCNILLDVEWAENDLTGKAEPTYKWLSAKQHTEQTGIPPAAWPQYQALMGDTVDGIRGVEGIGQKIAKDMIQQFHTAAQVIHTAKFDQSFTTPKKRQSLLDFESKLDDTLRLVTLRTVLPLEAATRLT